MNLLKMSNSWSYKKSTYKKDEVRKESACLKSSNDMKLQHEGKTKLQLLYCPKLLPPLHLGIGC